MAWGFLDWVRGRPFRAGPKRPTLPANPTRLQLREMSLRLLDDRAAGPAYEAVCAHPDQSRPVLETLLQTDPRFRGLRDNLTYFGRPVFDVVLSILFKWKSEYAVEEVSKLVASPVPASRKVAARLIAFSGEARFADTLVALTRDPDPAVRDAVAAGIDELLEYGRTYDRCLDRVVGSALYDFLRSGALRTDRGYGVRFAAAMFAVDAERAARDLASDVALTIDRIWLCDIVETLREQGITIDRPRLTRLLDDATAIFDRPNFGRFEYPGHGSLVSELLFHLAAQDPAAARDRMRALCAHRQQEAREAAQSARERLSADPKNVAVDALNAAGSVAAMRPEHRVVYLVGALDGEVANGGWLQWAANSDGEHALATLNALEQIGAAAAAALLRQFIETLGPGGTSPDQSRRTKAIDRMMSAGRSPPEDSALWDLSSDLRALVYDYADRHPDAFS